jgi:probable rRNA maturation factor
MEPIINNFSGTRIDRSLIKTLTRRVSKKKWTVSISFVSRSEMKKLNRKYRKKNKPTDVLSFSMKEGRLLGDVIICPSIAKANAVKYGSTFRSEIARLVVHGLLHLLGFDHGKKMFEVQEKILGGAYA